MERKMKILERIYQFTGVTPAIQTKVLLSLLLLILLRLVWLLLLQVVRRVRDDLSRYDLNRITAWLLLFIGVLSLGWIWFRWFEPWVIFLGLVTGATIIALKEVLFDFAGWIYLVWRRPLEMGDWVTIGEISGEVLDLDFIRFSLLETGGCEVGKLRSGRIIQLPNSTIFRERMVNYTKGYRYLWNECAVQLTLDSNWQKAKELLLRIVNRHIEVINQNNEPIIQQAAKQCVAFYNKLVPELYAQVSEGRIVLTVRFLCEPDKRRLTMHAIWEDVLLEFGQCEDIRFAKIPSNSERNGNNSVGSPAVATEVNYGRMRGYSEERHKACGVRTGK
jgi:small-conductance mechanosensitive channel